MNSATAPNPMLPRPEIESLERQSLENSHVSFRQLDALHESVKSWPPGVERDLELANISLLKERIGKEVFIRSQISPSAEPESGRQPSCMGGLHQGNDALIQVVTAGETAGFTTNLEQIKNRHGGMPPEKEV